MPAKSERRKNPKKTTERVMHEYKHGELKSGSSGKKVKSRKQAIAIAMSEAGTSKYQKGGKKRAASSRKKSSGSSSRGRKKSSR